MLFFRLSHKFGDENPELLLGPKPQTNAVKLVRMQHNIINFLEITQNHIKEKVISLLPPRIQQQAQDTHILRSLNFPYIYFGNKHTSSSSQWLVLISLNYS